MPTRSLNFALAALLNTKTAALDVYRIKSTGKWAEGLELSPNGVRTRSYNDTIQIYRTDNVAFGLNGKTAAVHTIATGKTNVVFGLVTVTEPEPVATAYKQIATKPRPTFSPGGHTIAANLDKPGMVAEWINMTAGGETIGTNGSAFPSAGYGFQISADDCTIRNCQCLVPFSEYFLYVRPGLKRALVENVVIKGGTNFEASIRNAGSDVTLRNVTVIQDHTGIDNKKARTLIRGPGEWTIEDCVFAGGVVGCNPMARLNAGQDLGFGEFQLGRGSGDPATSEGGQILRPTLMQAAVQAAIDARASGKTRRDIVRAAIVAGLVRSAGAPDIEKLIDDTLFNRQRMLAQRATVTFTRCKFAKSPDGVLARIEIQPGASVHFVDCEAPDGVSIDYESHYPDNNKYLDRHPTNTNWVLPGDVIRPMPFVRADRFIVAGKQYAVPEQATPPVP